MTALSKPVKRKLSNGLTVLFLHTPTNPVAACQLFIPAGACHERAAQSGIGMLAWALITKGTAQRNAHRFAEDVEAIGASISAGITHDYSEVTCHAISDYLPRALEMTAEALFQPVFAEDEVKKEQTALLAAIRSKKESIFTVANEALNGLLYGKHSYGRPASGDETTVGKLTRKDLVAWHRAITAPTGAVLSIAAAQPAAVMWPLINRLFGPQAWKRGKPRVPAVVGKTPATAKPVRVVREERFEQAYLLVGYPAPAVTAKDYLPLKVLNAVLGGGMSARLFQQLREQQGLAYDVGSFYPTKRFGSAFVAYMGLQHDKIGHATGGITEAFRQVTDKVISPKELEETKAYLKGTFILDHQTNGQRAHYMGWWELLGLGHAHDAKYLAGLKKVTPKQVQAVARKIITGKPVVVEIHPGKRAVTLQETPA